VDHDPRVGNGREAALGDPLAELKLVDLTAVQGEGGAERSVTNVVLGSWHYQHWASSSGRPASRQRS
jgi:hypothetical protein